MKTKKNWKDKHGIAGAVVYSLAAIFIVGIVALAFLAYTGVVAMPGNTDKAPDQDRDGDGKQDPFIGYLKVSAKMEFDNRNPLSGMARYVGEIKGSLVTDAPSTAQSVDLADIFAHDEEIKMKFVVTSPQMDVDWEAWDQAKVHVTGAIGGLAPQNYVVVDMTPDRTLAVRYHGTYSITCTMYEMDGDLVDSKSVNVVI